MLKVHLHAGLLAERNAANVLATLDIAYAKQEAFADYVVALTQRQAGEQAPVVLQGYPRWSASLWDLIARGIALSLYRDGKVPSAAKPDRRCAYATRLCAVIEKATRDDSAVLLGSAELFQQGPERGHYTVQLDEDILGKRTGQFAYGCKRLNPLDLLFRALCWALYGQDTPGARPKLIVPTSINIGGEDQFEVATLQEPARTGFARHLAATQPTAKPAQMARAQDYVQFLMEG